MDIFQNSYFQVNLLPYDGEVRHYGPIYSSDECSVLFNELLKDLSWKHEQLIIFGKQITTQRKVAWYGNAGLTYRYSNSVKKALSWTERLIHLRNKIQDLTGNEFNSCLANLYHNGEEGMGWHSDNEPELGKNLVIASLSLGATRKFQLKHNKTQYKTEVLLCPGSLLLMQGETQTHWIHQVPKMKSVQTARINLTFRKIIK
jgi:alkylated DNA repair dioxygenase AlkB